jgi:peptide/nickel transport system substrate-binding protein
MDTEADRPTAPDKAVAPDLPRGTVTFLFTDIEGSTRLLKQLGERYGDARADHHRLLRAAFAKHNGQEIDTQGDAFFVAFRRAKDAVAAAVDAQRALAEHRWPDEAQLRVRMGIHTGEPAVAAEGYLGLGVHRAARICSVGHGGQVLLSQVTVALLEDEQLPGVELRDLGLHHLKDIDRPERIHQLVIEGLPDTFPALKTVQAQPDRASPFAGREEELGEAAVAAVVRPWYRRRLAVSLLAAVLLAAVALSGALLTGGTRALARIKTDSVGLIDAGSNKIEKEVAVGSIPGAVASGAGALWVAGGDGTVSRIDPEANLVTQTIRLHAAPSGIAFGSGALWVASSAERTLRRISPSGATVGAPIHVGNGPSSVHIGSGAVWVTNRLDDTVSRVPIRGGKTKVFQAGLTPSGVTTSKDAVWITNQATGTVSRLDPKTGALQTISVGNGPTGIVFGDGAVWVTNSLDNTVSRIDPTSNTVRATIPVGIGPNAIATGAGSVWVTNQFGGTVSRIDPASDRVADTIKVGDSPGGIAVTSAGAWVSARAPLRNHRGGVLKVMAVASNISTVDPAAAYNQTAWQLLSITNDGLVTFKRVPGSDGGQIVPDLATEVPRASDGGKSYTFHLRDGIDYSDGTPVRASDFRRALERFFELHQAPPYYQSLIGGSACVSKPKSCNLRRGVLTDDAAGTVTFKLASPDADFLYELSLPFASAVPGDTPTHLPSAGTVPATGPYEVASFVPKKRVVLVRNQRFDEWSAAAQPGGFPDQIVFDARKDSAAQLRAVERGRADVTANWPPDRLNELTTRYTEQLHVDTAARTFFMFMNTRVPPFDQLDVRRAVNFAIDRAALIRAFHSPGQLQPSCQVLPPNFPGYEPYCPYTLNASATGAGTWTAPDLARAERLVKNSGTRGTKVMVWGFRDPVLGKTSVDVAHYVASVLGRLGYRASVKVIPNGVASYFSAVLDSRNRAQIGSNAWIADYPAPSAFIKQLFSCGSFTPNDPEQPNASEFCNPRIDSQIKRALRLQATDQAAANHLWTTIDREVTDEAPIVSAAAFKSLVFVSKRVGNYQFNPQWGLLVDQLWVR